jgi:sec-independent protein translocase protein TatC
MALPRPLRLFSTKPLNPVGEGGRMSLSDHFREFRARLLRVAVVVGVVFLIALFAFDPIFDAVLGPYNEARDALGKGVVTEPVVTGPGGPFLMYLRLCGLAALVLTSPYWLYEIWAFIMPGLHAHERKMSRVFAAIGGPLFMVGVAVGYLTLPKGLEVLIGFTPADLTSLVDFSEYLTFFSRTLLVFGVAFELPLIVVMLNAVGLVSGQWLKEHRPWIVVVIFTFGAIATPSGDPFTLLALAIPMTLLLVGAEVFVRIREKRRADPMAGLSPDEVAPLP